MKPHWVFMIHKCRLWSHQVFYNQQAGWDHTGFLWYINAASDHTGFVWNINAGYDCTWLFNDSQTAWDHTGFVRYINSLWSHGICMVISFLPQTTWEKLLKELTHSILIGFGFHKSLNSCERHLMKYRSMAHHISCCPTKHKPHFIKPKQYFSI